MANRDDPKVPKLEVERGETEPSSFGAAVRILRFRANRRGDLQLGILLAVVLTRA